MLKTSCGFEKRIKCSVNIEKLNLFILTFVLFPNFSLERKRKIFIPQVPLLTFVSEKS